MLLRRMEMAEIAFGTQRRWHSTWQCGYYLHVGLVCKIPTTSEVPQLGMYKKLRVYLTKKPSKTSRQVGKVKVVFPYSLPSVGPGADPGVQAVSPQVT